jgi:hypothetical protein
MIGNWVYYNGYSSGKGFCVDMVVNGRTCLGCCVVVSMVGEDSSMKSWAYNGCIYWNGLLQSQNVCILVSPLCLLDISPVIWVEGRRQFQETRTQWVVVGMTIWGEGTMDEDWICCCGNDNFLFLWLSQIEEIPPCDFSWKRRKISPLVLLLCF